MARSSTKKGPKVPANPNPPKLPSEIADLPSPFVLPSPSLATAFLSTLPQSHVYIVHVDTTPSTLKRRVFLVPVCMNIIISLGLLVRAYFALPVYFALLIATLGYSSEAKVDVKQSNYGALLGITASRTMLLLGDYILFSLLGSWPWNFVFGSEESRYGSPLKWRWYLGFRDKEIIVRSSKKWDNSLVPNWTLDDELTLKYKIMPAVQKDKLAKSGFLLLDKDWDLDFAAMAEAHRLVEEGMLKLEDFEKAVVVYHQPMKSWMIWAIGREDMPKTAEQRDTLLKFKNRLTAMGQEDLFYRWVELVQYESTMPGGFTEGRQATAMREARRMFNEAGVDFAKFWFEIGGSQGMPGLNE
jgi:hypothetical protein